MSQTHAGALQADELLALYNLGPADLERIRKLGERVEPHLEEYISRLYEWLETQPEFDELFEDRETVARVRRAQLVYWSEFFAGKVDEGYLDRRRHVGELHASVGLSLPAYFAAMNVCLDMFAEKLQGEAQTATSLSRMLHMDTAIVVETYSQVTSHRIAEQSRSLSAMSTPVTAIWRDILLLPVVGVVDSQRAQDIMTSMLTRISETNARVIILDIGGVAVVDTAVANHLIKITKATKLMGCECAISGVSPAIAQTIVELGIDVGAIETKSTLEDALAMAFRRIGTQVREADGG